MTLDQLLVLVLLLLPLVTAVIVWVLGPQRGSLIRAISFGCSVVVLILAGILVARFMVLERPYTRPSDKELAAGVVAPFVPEFVPGSTESEPHRTNWDIVPLGNGAIQFYLGVDGLNVWLIALTALLMMPAVLVSFWHIQNRTNEFYAWLLALQTTMLGVFLAFDIVLFYVFFELTLVPLFFLIGIWGGSERQYAARKFFIYTLGGSLITLLGILAVVLACSQATGTTTFSLPELIRVVHTQIAQEDPAIKEKWRDIQLITFLAISLGLAIKVPLLPFHTWLPLAHVEAPTAGSVDLAGILLKIGSYGFLRVCIPLAPDVALQVGVPLLTWLAAIGIIYGAFCAYAQTDIKRLIAYSSVSHVGLIMLGMFSFNTVGVQGSILQMVNHGLSTSALFLLVGMLYDRYHTRMFKDYSGMSSKMPLFGVMLVFASLSSVALPGLNGFVGEFLCLAGIYQFEAGQGTLPILTILGALGMLFGAWYMFTMLRNVLFGQLREPANEGRYPTDLTFREWGLLTPIFILCLILGVYPTPFLKTTEPDVERITLITERAQIRAEKESSAKSKPPGSTKPLLAWYQDGRYRP